MLSAASHKKRKLSKKRHHVTEEEVLTDSAKSDNGWIVCRTSSKHRLLRLGDPILCVGATFTISRKYSHKFLFGDEFELGKIHSVVRRHGSSAPFFKFYNMLDFPDHPPPLGSSSFMYNQCEAMMSTNEKVTGIKWTARSSTAGTRASRPRKQFFQKEYAQASRGLYDKEDQLESIRHQRKPRNMPQKSSTNGVSYFSSSSSSESDDDKPNCKSRNHHLRQVSSSSENEDSEFNSSDDEREFTSTKVTSVNLSTADYWIPEQW